MRKKKKKERKHKGKATMETNKSRKVKLNHIDLSISWVADKNSIAWNQNPMIDFPKPLPISSAMHLAGLVLLMGKNGDSKVKYDQILGIKLLQRL